VPRTVAVAKYSREAAIAPSPLESRCRPLCLLNLTLDFRLVLSDEFACYGRARSTRSLARKRAFAPRLGFLPRVSAQASNCRARVQGACGLLASLARGHRSSRSQRFRYSRLRKECSRPSTQLDQRTSRRSRIRAQCTASLWCRLVVIAELHLVDERAA